MVTFICPHCEAVLEAPEECDGMTNPCPECDLPVTLCVMDVKQVAVAGLVAGGLTLFASLLGFDD
jgi:hypothetical protein